MATVDDKVCEHHCRGSQLKPSVVDEAIDQWRPRLRVCVTVFVPRDNNLNSCLTETLLFLAEF